MDPTIDKKKPEYLLRDFDLTGLHGRIDLVVSPANGEPPVAIHKQQLVEGEDGKLRTADQTSEQTIGVEMAACLAVAQFLSKALTVSETMRNRVLGNLPKMIGGLHHTGNLLSQIEPTMEAGSMDELFQGELMSLANGIVSLAQGREIVMQSTLTIAEEIAAADKIEGVEKAGAVMSRANRRQFKDFMRGMLEFATKNGIDLGEFAPMFATKTEETDVSEERLTKHETLIIDHNARLTALEDKKALTAKSFESSIQKTVEATVAKMLTPGAGISPADTGPPSEVTEPYKTFKTKSEDDPLSYLTTEIKEVDQVPDNPTQ